MKTPVSRVGNKSSLLHILYAVFPMKYSRFVDVFGGSGSVLLGKPEVHPFEVYNDFDRNLVNLFHCMKNRTAATPNFTARSATSPLIPSAVLRRLKIYIINASARFGWSNYTNFLPLN